jgi:putative ABC transport system ATP-binding protein
MIVARNLTQRYFRAEQPSGRALDADAGSGRTLTVLDGVDLDIREGEVVVILGPSGSGKTTLLGLLAGLDRPSDGDVSLAGVDLGSLDEDGRAALRAERIGFIFQSFHLIPTLTALENVLVPLELLPSDRAPQQAAARATARTLLERVGLAGRLDHYPAQLSGGEQQRVGIARAFANEPDVLFADEPTGNLDRETGEEIANLLFELNEQRGTTLVIVTHDLELCRRAHRIVHLAGGRVDRIEGVEAASRGARDAQTVGAGSTGPGASA